MLITSCVCGGTDFTFDKMNMLDIKICKKCDLIHQEVPLSLEEYNNFYSIDYHGEYQEQIGCIPYKKRYEHDRKIAKLRLGEYNRYLSLNSKILDVGCGNGAFVDELRSRGFSNSYGSDLSCESNQKTTFIGSLESINFPTEHFDVITIHDALEHIPDLNSFMKELNRLVKLNGMAIIDFPDFFSDEGRHHWRPIQHLWYFNKDQIISYMERFGFYTQDIKKPIPSKYVFYVKKEVDVLSTGHKILLLPGMGDIYWVGTKLQSFCEKKNITLPSLYVWNFDNRPRSEDYVRRIPFVKFGGYHNKPVDDSVIRDSYLRHCKKGIIADYKEFDYYISANGLLRDGFSMDDDEFSEFKTDWYFPLFEPLEEKLAKQEYKEKYGKYIMCYFSDLGMFKAWTKDANQKMIYNTLKSLINSLDVRIVLTGCEWDTRFNKAIRFFDKEKNKNIIDMVGKTDIDHLFGLMKGAEMVIGWCGGNTIMSTRFRVPTLMFWNRYFNNKKFWNYACPPDSLGNWYFPNGTENYEMREIVTLASRLIR